MGELKRDDDPRGGIAEIFFPRFRRLRQGELNLNFRQPSRHHGLFQKLHACLTWGAAALDLIAGDASRNNIGPRFFPALNRGNDVIEGQLFSWKFMGAVLAAEVVANINILAGKSNITLRPCSNKISEFENARKFERESHRMHNLIMFFKDFNFSLKEKSHGLLPVHNFEWFVRCIKHQCVCQISIEGFTSPFIYPYLNFLGLHILSQVRF